MPAVVLRRAGALVFAGLQLAAAAPVYPQALSSFERSHALTMLSAVQDDIRKHYFNPAIGGVNLAAIVLGLSPPRNRRIGAATTC
ncbi:MAG: hypothetical protein ACRDLY_07695 [Thermoleophilaceae bacterium]